MYHYHAQVIRVIDGDTYELKVDVGFYMHMQNPKFRFRLLGCDTPEVRGETREQGEMVAEYVRNLIEGKWVEIYTEKSETDNFGRWLAAIIVDGINLTDHLIELGYAVPWVK